MRIERRDVGQVTVLDVDGHIAVGKDEDLLRETLRRLAEERRHEVVVDLTNVDRVDSTCIGILVATHVRLRDGGGSLRLLGPQRRVCEQLEIARLDQVFHIYQSEDAALAGPPADR